MPKIAFAELHIDISFHFTLNTAAEKYSSQQLIHHDRTRENKQTAIHSISSQTRIYSWQTAACTALHQSAFV